MIRLAAIFVVFVSWVISFVVLMTVILNSTVKADTFTHKYHDILNLKRSSCTMLADTIMQHFNKTKGLDDVRPYIKQYVFECQRQGDMEPTKIVQQPVDIGRP